MQQSQSEQHVHFPWMRCWFIISEDNLRETLATIATLTNGMQWEVLSAGVGGVQSCVAQYRCQLPVSQKSLLRSSAMNKICELALREMFFCLRTKCVSGLLISLDVMEMNSTRPHIQISRRAHLTQQAGHLISANHQCNVNHCDSYLILIREQIIEEGRHAAPFKLSTARLPRLGLGLSPFACMCVCERESGYQEVCLRKVAGWDCHVKNPLGFYLLSVPHTPFLFVISTMHTQKTHVHTAELYVTVTYWVHL